MIKKCVLICGYECNNNCIFCCNSEKRGRIRPKSTRELKEEMAGLKRQGYNYLELIGGEPTIREDIIDLVRFAKKLKFETIMFASNGRMFSYPSFMKRIIRAGLNSIVFSMHGHMPKLHDYLVGVDGAFSQLLRGVENAKKHRVQTGTNTIIVKQNYKFLPEIGKFIYNIGIRNAEFIFVDPTHGKAKGDFFRICPTYRETEPYINKLLKFGYSKKIPHWHIRYYPLCFVNPEYHGMISELHESRVFQTTHIAPDFINMDVKKSREEISKTKTGICTPCRYGKECEGVWREYFLGYGIDDIREKIRGGLTEVKLELTYDCDKRCGFCYNLNSTICQKDGLGMDEKIARKVIDIMSDEGIPSLRLTGGEPGLYAHLGEIISYAKQKDLKIILNTNGLAVRKLSRNTIKQLDEIYFPFNSLGSFKEIKMCIRALRKQNRKAKTFANTVLTSYNINNLEKYLPLIKKLGIKGWSLFREIPINEKFNPNDYDMSKLFNFLEKTHEEKTEIKIDNNFPFCAYDPNMVKRHVRYSGVCLGECSLFVSPDGSVRVCCSLPEKIGKITRNTASIKGFWKSKGASDFRNLKILPEECKDCKYLPECRGGCRFAAKKTTGSYYKMDPLANPGNIKKKWN